MTGKSSDVSKYRDSSKMNVVPPRIARFRPCTTTARLGSYVAEAGAVGAVRRVSSKPGTSVINFSLSPIKEAILRASSFRNSRARCGDEVAFVRCFFNVMASLFLAQDSRSALDGARILSRTRGLGNKSEGSGYRFDGV